MAAASMVDWDLAVKTARLMVRPGPQLDRDEARAVAQELVSLVPIAEQHVQDFTGLTIPDGHIPVAIVERVGWVQANLGGFQVALEPLVRKAMARRGEGRHNAVGGAVRAVGSRVTGVQVGALLAWLASRVLGQFELFLPPGEGDGRLTLVAPNIVETERKLDVPPHEFRLWVVLHEVTHRTQFTAVPWLREYFLTQVEEFVEASDLDPSQLMERLRAAIGAVRDALAGRDSGSLIEALQTPEQRVILARMQALMSLLEGHGDYVMDGVGPAVVPSIELIRRRFNERRQGAGSVDRAIRKLFGLDLKMRQYAEGERFVRRVVDVAGMAGFNTVWTGPAALPTLDEIRQPNLWLARMIPDRQPAAGSQ